MEFDLLSIGYSRVSGIAGLAIAKIYFLDGERGRSLIEIYKAEGEWFADILFFHIK